MEELQPTMASARDATKRNEHERSLGKDMRGQSPYQESYRQDRVRALAGDLKTLGVKLR